MDILVDSNVILDIVTEDHIWYGWSSSKLSEFSSNCRFFINPLIYSEVSISFERIEELDEVISGTFFLREHIPWEAAFLAGKCFLKYRKRGGARRSPLPDFFIGAHASVRNMTLLTRDTGRYGEYFPKLKIISP
ncbi:MAG TPA: DNA-binding protein [Lentisphaeria bacterium]|nr:MAG: DNA-binding protein [Lentisphaerae bacterium GWF2_49_21]HBC87010.1 DNA-binding protein [Lentisphaeria bacterium]